MEASGTRKGGTGGGAERVRGHSAPEDGGGARMREVPLAPSPSTSGDYTPFFFNHPATPDIYTLSLHDALPILSVCPPGASGPKGESFAVSHVAPASETVYESVPDPPGTTDRFVGDVIFTVGSFPKRWTRLLRSEEHTSELQSRRDLVCRLLLEK